MALPITLVDVNKQIDIELRKYYDLVNSNASIDEINNQKELLTELDSLRNSFLDNNEFSIMQAQALSTFNTAKISLSETDINTAFQYYENLSSYIKNNMIGYNENTNTPIFSTSESVQTTIASSTNLG